jgi:hypothetical protein
MNKALPIICLILIPLLLYGCKQISEQDAIAITQQFVNTNVKFYVNEGEVAPVVEEAKITILNTIKQDGNWNVFLNIMSNHTGEVKQSNLLVIVDAKNGNVLDMRKLE